MRMIRCSSVPARASTARTGAVSTATAHIGCSSPGGPGQHHHDRPAVAGTTSPGAVPTGSSTDRPARHERLLAVAGPQRLLVDVAPAPAQRAR